MSKIIEKPTGYKLTKSLEDYIKAIYIIGKRKRVVRVKDVANLLNVKPSSVSFSLKKLSEIGLVRYKKREYVDLTKEGVRVASNLSNRYSSIEYFLEKILGLPKDIAEMDACNMEHFLHKETVNRIKEFVKFVEKTDIIDKFIDNYKNK